MRALSLWQPWASAMALGVKRIETRHWSTSYRGPMAIHAAKRLTAEEREFLADMREDGFYPELTEALPLGAIVAVGRLVAILPTDDLRDRISPLERAWGNYASRELVKGQWKRRYGWQFEDIVPLSVPVPFKGAQGLFDIPDAVLRLDYRPPATAEPVAAVAAQGSLL